MTDAPPPTRKKRTGGLIAALALSSVGLLGCAVAGALPAAPGIIPPPSTTTSTITPPTVDPSTTITPPTVDPTSTTAPPRSTTTVTPPTVEPTTSTTFAPPTTIETTTTTGVPSITINDGDRQVSANQSVVLQGRNFAPGARVVVKINSVTVVMGAVTANSNGVATMNTRLPDVGNGPHTITMTGAAAGGGTQTLSIGVTMVGSRVSTASAGAADVTQLTDLPQTGATSGPLAAAGIGLLLGGSALLGIGRGRRSPRSKGRHAR